MPQPVAIGVLMLGRFSRLVSRLFRRRYQPTTEPPALADLGITEAEGVLVTNGPASPNTLLALARLGPRDAGAVEALQIDAPIAAAVVGDAFVSDELGAGPGAEALYLARPVAPPELTTAARRALHSGGISRRIVEAPVEDAIGTGWNTHSGGDRDVTQEIDSDHGLTTKAFEALALARRDGRSHWFLAIPKGETRDELGEGPHQVNAVHVVEEEEAYPAEYDRDIDSKGFGDPLTWHVTINREGFAAASFVVHRDRMITFEGLSTGPCDRRLTRLAGRVSVLEAYYWPIQRFEMMNLAIARIGVELSVPTLQMAAAPAARGGDQNAAVRAAVKLWNRIRSVHRVTFLNPGDVFTRVNANVAGLKDIVAAHYSALSNVEGIAVSKLGGQAPQGLSNSDTSGDSAYRQLTSRIRERGARPAISRFYDVALGKDPKRAIEFSPLDTPTEKDLAETSLARAKRDAILITQCGMPSSSSLGRFSNGEESALPVIDAEELGSDPSEVTQADIDAATAAIEAARLNATA